MSQTCPITPYSAKTSPYTSKEKSDIYTEMGSPYSAGEFCPSTPENLLKQDGFALLLQTGDNILLE